MPGREKKKKKKKPEITHHFAKSWGCVVELVKGQSHTEKAQKRSWVRVSTRTILCKMQTVVQAEPRYYTAE